MLGWINQSVEAFITESFGEDKWLRVLEASGVNYPWLSSCVYADQVTYDIVTTGAEILGVTVEQALEAYGVYFVKFTAAQGYNKLMDALGSNIVEFLSNLNNLHLHLTSTFPDMVAPAFRCENVTPESLELHYFSARPALWPIVVGVLKGLAKERWGFPMDVEMLKGRDSGHDHEVFMVRFPYQQSIRTTMATAAAECHGRDHDLAFTLSPEQMYTLHPFHMLMDSAGTLLQVGAGLVRVLPHVARGQPVGLNFKVLHPYVNALDEACVKAELHSAFLLRSRAAPKVTLKGQMVLCKAGGRRCILFMGSPRCGNLSELLDNGLHLADFPLHDMGRDFVLLAEQRAAEAELKAKYETLANEYRQEKARADALVQRMSVLLQCMPSSCSSCKAGQLSQQAMSESSGIGHVEVIEAVRRAIAPQLSNNSTSDIEIKEALSEGAYGKVYRALWQGTEVALKTALLPSGMSGAERREKMAIMEAAISSTLSHPNIVQTYTYTIAPVKNQGMPTREDLSLMGIEMQSIAASHTFNFSQSAMSRAHGAGKDNDTSMPSPDARNHDLEVRLVLELCDLGSLRDCLDIGMFKMPEDGSLNYVALLDVALDTCKAMVHLHRQNVLHSDLKSRNVMMKSAGHSAVAKVGDFGLSVKMDHMDTHMSDMYQGTLTHMAPEVLLEGRISKAADV